ncbi:hypothetical protein ABB37_00944 [Leptomonas pyrrhocoris]|uniref:Cytochrome b5 heme-binding domain-containing protein n=1 Tax=Leptomonas pyrrhocoris TaxID=157538 RepID=A0A0M9GBE9_LEPPY|nr:hypothetical protein ABB37_00944 [Leptomonas pyrrhocoris]KPA86907.1 hypothetical protein ABB37_00944 [Leptomonas pyrrhocoris]|eukprot:XP_015665346.1 hypothetical protein ABB37_00944 [Leptomonas pyrrhocoris]
MSASASLLAPPTPSNWMVRGPSSNASLVTLSALGVGTNHDSAASGSSFNSSAGNPTLSPLLHPYSRNSSNSMWSYPAAHDSAGEVEGADGVFLPMERASGRKRTPRPAALSGETNSSSSGVGGGNAVADADIHSTPSPARLMFSHRTSARGGICENGDDAGVRAHRPGSFSLVDDDAFLGSQSRLPSDVCGDEDSVHTHFDGHKAEVQSMLHSTRSRGSVAATTTTTMATHTSSPMTSSLPSVTLGVMSAVPPPPVDLVTRVSSISSKALGEASRSTFSTPHNATVIPLPPTVGATPAATANSHRRTHTPVSPRTPVSFVPSGDQPLHTTSSHIPRVPAGPLKSADSPTRLAGPLGGRAVGSGCEVQNRLTYTSHHFASAVELQTWTPYSTVSSSGSLLSLGNGTALERESDDADASSAATAAGVGQNTFSNSTSAGQRNDDKHDGEGHTASASMLRHAGVSATNVTATFAPFLHPAAASATGYPFDNRKVLSLSAHDATYPSKPSAADSPAPTPLADAWTADSSAAERTEQRSNTSRSSSGSGSGHRQQRRPHHRSHGAPTTSSSPSHHGSQNANVLAVVWAATGVCAPSGVSVPVFSSTETRPVVSVTTRGHNSGSNFLNYHPNFSRTFHGHFGTTSAAAAPTGNTNTAATTATGNVRRSRKNNGIPVMPSPPPLPPPSSRIPSPIVRTATNIICGFAAATAPAHHRPTATFGAGSPTAQLGGGLQCGSTSSAPPPPPPPSLAERDNTKQQQKTAQQMRSLFSTLPSDRCSSPRHGTDEDNDFTTASAALGNEDASAAVAAAAAVQTVPSAMFINGHHSTPDEHDRVEALIGGMPMMVVQPAVLRPQPDGVGGGPTNPTATPTAVSHGYAHGPNPHLHSCLRDSSLGSSSGAHGSPCAKARPSVPPTAFTTGQSREFLYTSDSSAYTSTPQTLTSTASDPLLLSLSSANLAAPMTSNGSNGISISNCYPVNSNNSGGALTTAAAVQSTSVGVAEGFVMKPDAETIQRLPRGKVPRMPGCSMRDWTAHLSAKEAKNRRGHQQQQRRGSVSSLSSEHRQRAGSNSGFGSPSSGSPGGTAPAFPSSAAQHPPGSRAALPRMTPQEVSRHNTPDDLWMVIRNVVYDCTEFQRFHPGGEKLLLACAGRDATDVYDRFHAWVSCESFMGPYAVGILAPPPQQ